MSIEANKEMILRLYEEGLSNQQMSIIEASYAAPLHDQQKHILSAIRASFPDILWIVEEVIAEEDKIVTRWVTQGTHKGRWRGIEPTDKSVSWSGVTIDYIDDGKIIDEWVFWNRMDLYVQLAGPPEGFAV